MKKWLVIVGLIVAVWGAYAFVGKSGGGLNAADFEMAKVRRGTIVYEITASGKIQPINTVTVGTQVSGIVEKVLVDYNDEVKKGQLLAKLDTFLLTETMNDSKARLDLAKTKKEMAQLNFSRIEKLYNDKLISKASFEESEIELKSKSADVLIATADYNKAKRNFEYASIVSPVSGTVISKEVEQGQTVAASLQTPTLFSIAEDLSKMQIEASIAEADIGSIVAGMPVTFTVDAYPNNRFDGIVRQVRLSPTEEQNVVMYTVVIEVDNSSRKLLPGMTASLTIKVQEAKDVLRVSAMAMQYKPSSAIRATMDTQRIKDIKENQDVVYQFRNGKVTPVSITKGLSDMTSVEIVDGLKEGDEVIIDAVGSTRGKRR